MEPKPASEICESTGPIASSGEPGPAVASDDTDPGETMALGSGVPSERVWPFRPRDPGETPPRGRLAELPFEFAFEGHYDVLGVARGATIQEAKAAENAVRPVWDRRSRAGEEGANDHLEAIQTAGETLTKPEKRAAYDRLPDALFLSIQDLARPASLAWGDGLALIRGLLREPGDPDPAGPEGEPRDIGRERPNQLLERLIDGK
jgi:hypothetical protein